MNKVFKPQDILRVAIEVEKNGMALYGALVKESLVKT